MNSEPTMKNFYSRITSPTGISVLLLALLGILALVFFYAGSAKHAEAVSGTWVSTGYNANKCVSQSCPWAAGGGPPATPQSCSTVGSTCTDCSQGLGGFETDTYTCQSISSQTTATCTVVVADPGVTGCTVTNATPPLNQQVTYTATGGSAPYTWTPSSPSSCTASTGSTKNCTFTTAGPYTMSVAGSSGAPVSCTLVTAATPALTLTATPSRVTLVNGSAPTTVTWSATNVSSCGMTRNGAVYTPQAPATLIPNSSGVLSSPSVTDIVTGQTVYKLSCNGATATAIVNVTGGQTEF